MRRVRTAVLISGNGSNLQALLDVHNHGGSPVDISLVISNKSEAYGLQRAAAANVKTVVISHKDYPTREAFDTAMTEALRAAEIELVVLAGFMRILSTEFVETWSGRLVNIHPSLLPKYKGLDTHARAIEAGDTEHGATVHWVIPELDAGKIIAQAKLNIEKGETPESLQARVHVLEHQLYPEAVRKVALQLQ